MKERIAQIMDGSHLFPREQNEVVELFSIAWERLYKEGEDTIFETHELKRFWCWLKLLLLLEKTKEGDRKAKRLYKWEMHNNSGIYSTKRPNGYVPKEMI